MSRGDDFSPEERALLGEWTAPEPPAGFAERVVDRAPPVRSRSRAVIGVIAGLAAAAAIAGLTMFGGREVKGELRANERTAVALGDRGVAVAEDGAELSYLIDRTGEAKIDQKSGDVFYRVERGGPFVVHTPQGEISVLGTCFRVEVSDMRAGAAGLIGAGVGAVVATTVMVTVYEGKVVTASPQGSVTLAAGESAKLEDQNAPVKLVKKIDAPEKKISALAQRELETLTSLPANATPEQVLEAHRALSKEANKMREEIAELKTELEKKGKKAKMVDIDHDELVSMAERCELRWDMQGMGGKRNMPPDEALQKLGIDPSEREVIERVLDEDSERISKEIASLYVEVTGDTTSGSMSPSSMFEEINDKAPEGEIRRVFHRLSRERAGMIAPPPDLKAASPWERLFRLVTTSGDALESSLAKELGPETAKALRGDGWGQRSRSSNGCPGEASQPE